MEVADMENIPPISAIEDAEETTAAKIIDPGYGRPIKPTEPVVIAAQEAADLLGYSVDISTGETLVDAKTDNELHHVSEVLHSAFERSESLQGHDEITGESWEVRAKCVDIAACIMSGNGILPEDQQYLIEHNPELYSEAISERMLKEGTDKIDLLLGNAKPEILSPADGTTELNKETLASKV
jgi:hypothetical protein